MYILSIQCEPAKYVRKFIQILKIAVNLIDPFQDIFVLKVPKYLNI